MNTYSHIKRSIINLLLLLITFSLNAQKQCFVSAETGSDANDGLSKESPLESITAALDKFNVTEGGVIYLLESIFQEEVLIDGKSNITIKPYEGANVAMDGTEVINSQWEPVAGIPHVYRTPVSKNMWQLFINNKEQIMARWPNTTFAEDEIYRHEFWAICDNNSPNGRVDNVVSNDHGHAFPAGMNKQVSGGMLVANFGSFRTFAQPITSNIDGNSFEYEPASITLKTKHRYYFIEGKLHLLDSPNEWFFEEENGIKYVYTWSRVGDGSDLNTPDKVIRGKVQSYAFDIRNAENISIEGIKFFATTTRIYASKNVMVRNCIFSYPNCSMRMLKSTNPPLVTSIDQDLNSGSLKSSAGSSNCTFEGNVFEYTDGEAFIAAGNGHMFRNNYIHHIDWSCANTQGLGLTVYVNGYDFEFSQNTLHTTGASATLNLGKRSKILFNDLSNTGYAQSDGAVVQHTTNSVAGSETAYNWIHDTGKYGFRFDAPASSPCTAGEYGLAHHNVIWNIGDPIDNTGGVGMMIKGDHQQIYNNTVFNCLKTDILIIDEACSSGSGRTNQESYTRNNLADFISGHRSEVYSNAGQIPGLAVTNNVSQWKDEVPGANTSDVTYDISNGLLQQPVFHFFPGAENEEGAVKYNSRHVIDNSSKYDFRPISEGTDIIDKGYDIESTAVYDMGEANVNVTNSTFNPSVGTPDIGAYEAGGTFWVPGIDFTPVCYPWEWPFDRYPSNIFTPDQNLDVTLYPQPATKGKTVKVSCDEPIKNIVVYNLNGQVVDTHSNTSSFSTARLSRGMFIVHIQSINNRLSIKKLLIQ